MEGLSGSSGEPNANSSERRKGGDGLAPTPINSRFDDQDDPLLDLSDDREAQNTPSRLLFDFTSDRYTRASGDNSEKTRWQSALESGSVSTQITDQRVLSTATSDNRFVTIHNRRLDYLTPNSDDFLRYGDPTFLSTDVPFHFEQPQRTSMDNQTQLSDTVASVKTDKTSVGNLAKTSDSETSRPAELLKPNTMQDHSRTVAGNRWSPEASDGRVTLPDVSLRQPLLQPSPDSQSKTSCPSGMVIDYTDGSTAAHLTHTSGSGHSRAVLMDSFPPPTCGATRGVEDGDRPQQGEEELHCHSGINRHRMNDKLARRQLLAVLVLCIMFMIGEAVGGALANSLALFTDVLHLASDLISYVISLLALYLARKNATRNMTFGYHRAEVLGAMFSVFVIWLVSGVLCYIAVERIVNKHYMEVKPDEMLITASLGVVFNLVMGFVLHSEKCCKMAKNHAKFGHGHSHSHSHNSHSHNHYEGGSNYDYEPLDVASHQTRREEEEEDEDESHHHKNINVRAAFIHVVGDIIQSIGVLVAALIIKFKEDEKYRLADPICTFVFSLLVLITTINVLRDAIRIIMEGAPQGVDHEKVKTTLMGVDSVVSIHNLHVWSLTIDRNALSVHLAVDNWGSSKSVLHDATTALKSLNFYHVTIQVEPYSYDVMSNCSHCQLPKS